MALRWRRILSPPLFILGNDKEIKTKCRYLFRILENLFSNITKYVQEKSRVYIDAEEKDKNIKWGIFIYR